MKRVGIFGGSFDPPHEGHRHLVASIQRRMAFDLIMVVVAFKAPHKNVTCQQSFEDRLRMTSLAFEDLSYVQVSAMESARNGPSYTVDTLASLKHAHADWSLYLMCGADAYHQLRTWYSWQRLFDYASVIIASRPGYERNGDEELERQAAQSREGMMLLGIPELDLSSSQIRHLMIHKQGGSYGLPTKVWQYIQDNQLYHIGKGGEG